jgi:hypothetical protein
MDGLTKTQIDKAESRDFAKVPGRSLRPRDAATLILIDRSGGDVRVLLGRRSARHAFMPGRFVFPGGRTDPSDSRIPVAEGLAAEEEAGSPRPAPVRRSHAHAPSRSRRARDL